MTDAWEQEMDAVKKQQSSTSDFYKFTIGDHVMRIMSQPVKKESRFDYGICYPGATYCDPAVIEKEYEEKMEKYGRDVEEARKRGATQLELRKMKKPSRATIGIKWVVWALVRAYRDEKGRTEQVNELKIVDLPHGVSEALLALKQDKDMGTNFDGFPMPYDIKITVKKKDTKGRTWTPKDVVYSLTAGQKRADVTDEEKEMMEKKKPVADIIERMQEKKREDDGVGGGEQTEESNSGPHYNADDINPDDIPF